MQGAFGPALALRPFVPGALNPERPRGRESPMGVASPSLAGGVVSVYSGRDPWGVGKASGVSPDQAWRCHGTGTRCGLAGASRVTPHS